MNVPRRYGLLRAIGVALKVLGVLALLLGLAGMVLVLANGRGTPTGDLMGALGLPAALTAIGAVALPLLGLIWFIQLFAFGSILTLLIEIEENTRAMALPPA